MGLLKYFSTKDQGKREQPRNTKGQFGSLPTLPPTAAETIMTPQVSIEPSQATLEQEKDYNAAHEQMEKHRKEVEKLKKQAEAKAQELERENKQREEIEALLPSLPEKEIVFLDTFAQVSNILDSLPLSKNDETTESLDLLYKAYRDIYLLQQHIVKKELAETPVTLRPFSRVHSDFILASSRIWGNAYHKPLFLIIEDVLEHVKLIAIEYASYAEGRAELLEHIEMLADKIEQQALDHDYEERYSRLEEALVMLQEALVEGEGRSLNIEIPESEELVLMDSLATEYDYMLSLSHASAAYDNSNNEDSDESLNGLELLSIRRDFEITKKRLDTLIEKIGDQAKG